ncbi:MAG: hypothetical protein N4A47_00160 [Clostridia bacterium]|jgi:hypothetical protein|nr:hypothetical protein [Clostridia bacterium]
MTGRVMITIFNIFFITYIILFIAFYYVHQGMQENVEQLLYEVTDNISTSAEFSANSYRYLSQQLKRYGNFDIKIKYEEYIGNGHYEPYFDDNYELFLAYFDMDTPDEATAKSHAKEIDVVSGRNYKFNTVKVANNKFKIGDRVTILVEGTDLTMFGRLINASLLGAAPDTFIDKKIQAIKSVPISNNPHNIDTGYDVKFDIDDYLASGDDVIIEVETRANKNAAGANSEKRFYMHNVNVDSLNVNLSTTVKANFLTIPAGNARTGSSYSFATDPAESFYIPVSGKFEKEVVVDLEGVDGSNRYPSYTYIKYTYAGS